MIRDALTLAVVVSLFPVLGGGPAAAQEATPSDTIPVFELDSLLVAVLRTPTRLGASAYPVSVVGGDDLRTGKTGMFLEEALEGLPGIQVQNRYNYAVGERVTIRGFGARAQFGVRGIHAVVDGVPATLPDGQSTLDHVNIASLGRVEALRGPAAALYGNAAGGVLRFETEIPAAAPLRQEVDVVAGEDGLLRLQSTTSGTAGRTGYLLSVDRLSYDNFREHPAVAGGSYGGAERIHVNGRLEQPLAGGDLGVSLNVLDLDAENPGAVPADLLAEDRRQIVDLYIDHRTGKEVRQGQLGATWSGAVAGFSAEVMAYGLVRDFLNPIPFRVIDVERQAGGARLMLGDAGAPERGGFRWRGGVEVDAQSDDRREFGNDGGRRGDLQLDQEETVRSTGLFLQGTLPLGGRAEASGGIRYDRFLFEVDDRFPASLDPTDDSGERTMDSWSPTVGLHVEAGGGLDLFGNVSTFFQTPTTVELANRPGGAGGFNPELEPQTGVTVEAGARGGVRQRLTYEAAFFRTGLENELVPFEVPDAPGVTYFRNSGSSTRKGVEAMVRARLHERLTGRITYAYTDARFDDYEVDGEDFEGKRIPGLAPHQLRAGLRYGADRWYLDVGAEHTDRVPVDDANEASADAYTLLDVRLGAEGVRLPGGVDASPFVGVRNVTDEVYSSAVTVNAFGGRYFEPGPGRAIYVGLRTGWSAR